MKKILFMIFCFVSNKILAQSDSFFGQAILDGKLTMINEGLDGNDYWRLSNGMFMLNKHELRLLRNTIYAKHGYTFNSKDMQDHFSQFAWYKGTKNNVEAELTETDRENIRLTLEIEANYPQTLYENIIGYWIDFRGYHGEDAWDAIDNDIGSKIADYPFFSIYPNGTFFAAIEGEYYGLWRIENNKLILNNLFSNNASHDASFFDRTIALIFYEIQSPGRKKYLQ